MRETGRRAGRNTRLNWQRRLCAWLMVMAMLCGVGGFSAVAEGSYEAPAPQVEPAAEPEAPAAEPEAPAADPDAPAADPDAPAADPDAPAADPDVPATDPDTPAADPDVPAVDPDVPATDPDAPQQPEPAENDAAKPATYRGYAKVVLGEGEDVRPVSVFTTETSSDVKGTLDDGAVVKATRTEGVRRLYISFYADDEPWFGYVEPDSFVYLTEAETEVFEAESAALAVVDHRGRSFYDMTAYFVRNAVLFPKAAPAAETPAADETPAVDETPAGAPETVAPAETVEAKPAPAAVAVPASEEAAAEPEAPASVEAPAVEPAAPVTPAETVEAAEPAAPAETVEAAEPEQAAPSAEAAPESEEADEEAPASEEAVTGAVVTAAAAAAGVYSVSFKVVDQNGNALPGVSLSLSLNGSSVHTWTSSSSPEQVSGINANTEYLLIIGDTPAGCVVTSPADGYTTLSVFSSNGISYDGDIDSDGNILIKFQDNRKSVRVLKVDGDDEALGGASLRVFCEEDGDEKIVDNWVSGDAEHVVSGLVAGVEYTLMEIQAPLGYAKAESVTFTVGSDGKVDSAIANDDGVLVLKNYLEQGVEARILVVHGAGDEKGLAGASVKVYYEEDDEEHVVDTWTSTTEAHLTKNLQADFMYRVTLTAPPDGYFFKYDDLDFTVKSDGVISNYRGFALPDSDGNYVLYVPCDPTYVNIKETDADGAALGGATLRIVDSDGESVEEWISYDGFHTITSLLVGKEYTLKEITPPDGYLPVADVKFTIHADKTITSTGTVVGNDTLLLKNEKTRVGFLKVDADSGEPVDDARLELILKSNGEEILIDSWTSGGDPHYVEGLIVGKDYTLHERSWPAGYTKASDIKFSIKSDGSVDTDAETTTDQDGTTVILMKDTYLQVSVLVVDADDGEPIEGVIVDLYEDEGDKKEKVDTWETGTKAKTLQDLKVGTTYELVATPLTNCYIPVGETPTFTVNADGTVDYNGNVDEDGNLLIEFTITKVSIDAVDTDGSSLSGASLSVTIKDSRGATTWVSDGEPHTIEGLLIKTPYIITETDPPANHMKAQEVTFSIDDDGSVITSARQTSDGTILIEHEPIPTVSVTVTKQWEDQDDYHGLRPGSIQVKLLANGEEAERVKITEKDKWTHTFEDLPLADEDGSIEYKVEEIPVSKYEGSVEGDVENGFTITNTHEVPKVDFTGTIIWTDGDNQDGIRPTSVSVYLARSTTSDSRLFKAKNTDATMTADTGWTYTWTDLEATSPTGEKYIYHLYETTPSGYTRSYPDSTHTVLRNTHTPEEINIVITKIWEDDSNREQVRPASIDVTLFADGEEVGSTTMSGRGNQWTYTFKKMPKYKNEGQLIDYSISEVSVEGYEVSSEGSASEGFVIINTHQIETVSINVTKKWNDSGDYDGVRPDAVTIELLDSNNRRTGDKLILTKEMGWKGTFENVPKYDRNLNPIQYKVTEVKVMAYSFKVKGDMETGFTVTNRHTKGTGLTTGDVFPAWPFILAGVGVLSLAAAVFINRKRKRG